MAVSVFVVEELNQNIEDHELWQRDFLFKKNREFVSGAAIKSKMVVVTSKGRSVEIYDFWPDREYEVTEDMDSEESGDEDWDDSDYGVEDGNE